MRRERKLTTCIVHCVVFRPLIFELYCITDNNVLSSVFRLEYGGPVSLCDLSVGTQNYWVIIIKHSVLYLTLYCILINFLQYLFVLGDEATKEKD